MNVYVCVGSSCHLRGSYKIIELMKENIEKKMYCPKLEQYIFYMI